MSKESTGQKQLVNVEGRVEEQHEESKKEPEEQDGGEGKDMSGGKWKYHDKDWLKKQYADNKSTVQDVADECGVKASTVSDYNQKFELKPKELRNQDYGTKKEKNNEESEKNKGTENEGSENEGSENEGTENEGTENEGTENEKTEDTGDGFMEQLKQYSSWVIGIGGLIFGIVYAGQVANQKEQEVQEYQQEAEEYQQEAEEARTEARQFQQAFQEQQKQQEEQAKETQENNSSRTRATDYFQNHVK